MTDTVTAAVSPIARKLAEKLGVDLSSITGTGPNGTIVRADIEKATGELVALLGPSGSGRCSSTEAQSSCGHEPVACAMSPKR